MCIAGHIHPFQGLNACLDTVNIQYTPDVWRDQTYVSGIDICLNFTPFWFEFVFAGSCINGNVSMKMKYKGSRYCVLQETSNISTMIISYIFTMIISGWTRLRREGIYNPQKHTKYLEEPKEFFDQLMQLKGKVTFNWTLHLMKKTVTLKMRDILAS